MQIDEVVLREIQNAVDPARPLQILSPVEKCQLERVVLAAAAFCTRTRANEPLNFDRGAGAIRLAQIPTR